MEYRNAQFNEDGVTIDCEILHDVYGWIPYTIDPQDTDNTIDNAVLAELIGDDVAQWVPPTEEELEAERQKWRDVAAMSRVDFAIAAATFGWVTDVEAEEWASGFANPQIVLSVIETLPQSEQLKARIAARTQPVIHRSDNLVLALQQIMSVSDHDFDSIFGWQ